MTCLKKEFNLDNINIEDDVEEEENEEEDPNEKKNFFFKRYRIKIKIRRRNLYNKNSKRYYR